MVRNLSTLLLSPEVYERNEDMPVPEMNVCLVDHCVWFLATILGKAFPSLNVVFQVSLLENPVLKTETFEITFKLFY